MNKRMIQAIVGLSMVCMAFVFWKFELNGGTCWCIGIFGGICLLQGTSDYDKKDD